MAEDRPIIDKEFILSEYRRYAYAFYRQLYIDGPQVDFYHGVLLGIELSFMWLQFIPDPELEKIKEEAKSEAYKP